MSGGCRDRFALGREACRGTGLQGGRRMRVNEQILQLKVPDSCFLSGLWSKIHLCIATDANWCKCQLIYSN